MKRILAILLAAVMLITCAAVPAFAEEKIMYGDVNGDGKIGLLDVRALLQYLADWDVEIDLEAADVTHDGKVNVTDATKILNYLAGWPNHPY